MTDKTVGDYYEQLRPAQRHFILWCINRKPEQKIQPGLLPFVSAQQAVMALQDRLDDESFYGGGSSVTQLDNKPVDAHICHVRYIRHLISVMSDGVDLSRYRDQADVLEPRDSTILTLNTKKLFKLTRRRYATFFVLDSIHLSNVPISTPIEFLQRTHKTWLITANTKYLDRITTALAEQCR